MDSRAKALLVEDDAMLRQFVRMSLEDLPVDLLECDSVASALAALRENGPVQLVMTDLMMPGQSGLDLIRHLAGSPRLRGAARMVVLSAGVTAPVRNQLDELGVWRVLLKPVSVLELAQCVSAALEGPPVAAQAPTRAAAADAASADAEPSGAVDQYFGGNVALFNAYLASCRSQFPIDINAGDMAMASGNLGALRHLAHSLKSVLRTLGFAGPSERAGGLEASCRAGDREAALPQWQGLRGDLRTLAISTGN